MSQVIDKLSITLADTYAIYLKTQNYHWHVKGPNFKSIHQLLEDHYTELAGAVDDIAERILTLGSHAPASFDEFNKLTQLKNGDAKKSAADMLTELRDDHTLVISSLTDTLNAAQSANDEGTVALISERIAHHEKMRWMLDASH